MKKIVPLLIIAFLMSLAALTACTSREQGASGPSATPASESGATPVPTATPTPSPSPAPFEYIVENARAGTAYDAILPCSSYEDIFDAAERSAANAAADFWAAVEPDGYISENELPVVTAVTIGDTGAAGDIMACDGSLLYILAEKDLLIVRLNGEETKLLSRTKVGTDWTAWEASSVGDVNGSEKIPVSLFVYGHRLAILSDYYNYCTENGELGYTEYAALDVYDVTDPTAPTPVGSLGQDGEIRAAGISGGAFYLVTAYTPPENAERGDSASFVPCLYSKEQKSALSPEKAWIAADGKEPGCALVAIYELTSGRLLDARAVYGVSPDPFIGDGEMFFFSTRAASGFSRHYDTADGTADEIAAASCTDLIRLSFDSGSFSVDTPATILGALSGTDCLYQCDGVLSCVVSVDQRRFTTYSSGQGDAVREQFFALCRLDEDMTVMDFTPLASEGNEDGWVGFLADRAVFTGVSSGISTLLDMSDPQNVSLSFLSDAVMADTVRSLGENGYSVFYRSSSGKLTLTVYDSSFSVLDRRVFGSDHSNTLENRSGYFTHGEGELIAFSADDSYCVYGLDENGTIILIGDVYLTDWAWNARGFWYDDTLYVADTREIVACNLSDFSDLQKTVF